ncbi:MAG TPA: adenosylcobinamide-GDP ribazoletransferase [Sporichthyaceae bacterium]|nr:adenosylcobinamide-GDP ribazoletransferase [Sporichthyaceae bacterium]
MIALDGLRLSLGTLTVIPVGAVRTDRATAGAAMLWAPVVGAALGATAGGAAWACGRLGTSSLVAAVCAVAVPAGLTRGLHLDGLADTADGLGSAGGPEQALAVMKRSDIGPFGVVTLVLVLLAQVAALSGQLGYGHGHRIVAAMVLAATAGRGNLPWACRGPRAARPNGLGAMVAGTVDPMAAAGATALVVSVQVAVGGVAGLGMARCALAATLSWAAAEVLLRKCERRFGGITGDVLGALVEIGTTVVLVVLSTAPFPYD